MNLRGQGGYAMAALLVALAVMSVMLAVAMPVWKTAARREKEEELVFRGEQYARALMLYQRQVANAAPPSIDLLVQQHFLRKKYKDPITNDDFAILTAGSPALNGSADDQAGRGGAGRGGSASPPPSSGGLTGSGGTTFGGAIVGVTSKSKDESLRLYNGRNHYNEWVFTPTQRTQTPGAPGAPTTAALPGVGGQPAGRGGQRGGGPVRGQPFGAGGFGGQRGGAAPPGRAGPGPLGVRPGGLPPEAPQRPQPPPG